MGNENECGLFYPEFYHDKYNEAGSLKNGKIFMQNSPENFRAITNASMPIFDLHFSGCMLYNCFRVFIIGYFIIITFLLRNYKI